MINFNKLSNGLQYEELYSGKGLQATEGKFVHVKYIGKLPNNKEFDRSTNKPFSFRLGAGEVIQGWDQGVAGMRVGGKRRLIIPSHLAYGSRRIGPIPANSTLHFDVELVAVS
ncbi:Peptidyl-prolyl cis-trans isomerase fkbp4 [Blomia tropicalis]|nr:Peptidyl-prolyl cis-trans isomerase fkbp4 [Blomia tropicalis]